jgi:hypothetical protein
VTTVAQVDFSTKIGNAPLDNIIISCDGVNQKNYEKYRVHGELDKVFKFMQYAALYKNRKTRVTWKYILFEHNDSVDEIETAQELAEEFSIDDLLFVITNTKNRSQKFTLENLGDFPIRSSKARVMPCAGLQRIKTKYIANNENLTLASGTTEGYIDKVYKINSGHLVCEGWSIGKNGLPLISLKGKIDDGSYINATSISEKRDDVKKLLPAKSSNIGFVLYLPYPKARLNYINIITIQVIATENSVPIEFMFAIGSPFSE